MAIAPLKAFKYYRVNVTGTAQNPGASTAKYVTINELEMFEFDVTGTNLCATATATASGFYAAGTEAPKAIDGNATTFWESAQVVDNWLKVELTTAKVVRQIRITSSAYPNEVPRNFQIVGSNDNSTWEAVLTVVDWVTTPVAKTGVLTTNRLFGGVSKTSDGLATASVEIYTWDTGEYVGRVIPDAAGGRSFREHTATPRQYLVVHKGPAGYKPQADGPVTSYVIP